jgi:hypothetical protein
MLSFSLDFIDQLYTSWTPTFGEFMPHYSPRLVELWTYVSSLLLSHTPSPTGEEHVVEEEPPNTEAFDLI